MGSFHLTYTWRELKVTFQILAGGKFFMLQLFFCTLIKVELRNIWIYQRILGCFLQELLWSLDVRTCLS